MRIASPGLGACATTLSGSAKWTDETVAALAGRDCLILEDNDEAGREKALTTCFEAPLWVRPPKGGLPFIDMSKWDGEPAPPREWCVPLRQPTIFSGEGAVGKSLLDLMRSVAHVLGKSWLGKTTEPGPAIYLGAEDEESELHRRVADVLAHYDATFACIMRSLECQMPAGS